MRSHFRFATLLALASLALYACEGEKPAPAPAPTTQAPAVVSSPSEGAKSVASLPPPYDSADYDMGRRLFAQCRSCHLISEGAPRRRGPNLYGVLGRKAGAEPGFEGFYSKALLDADFIWTPELLDRWLIDTQDVVPGNGMRTINGLSADQRKNLIAYIMIEEAK